jgi:hypothetical protein
MLVAVFLLTVVGGAAEFAWLYWRFPWGQEGPHLRDILFPLGLNFDGTIPEWYSALALLLCSILLGVIAASKKQLGERYTGHWGVLSGIFLLLSVDEVASLHNKLNYASTLGSSVGLAPTGFLSYFWVVPGIVIVLIFVLAYLGFLFHLPKKTLLLFVGAGGLFVAGAIGMEMLAAGLDYYILQGEQRGMADSLEMTMIYHASVVFEEFFEMLSVVLFVYALLSYIGSYTREVTIQIRTRNEIEDAGGATKQNEVYVPYKRKA